MTHDTMHDSPFPAERRKPAPADQPILGLLRERWSPRAFLPKPLEPATLRLLFEALRWAPSAFNDQPWSFLVATPAQPQAFARLLACLTPGNQAWAQHAPVLVLSVVRQAMAGKPQPNRTAAYDLGQAVACLTVQATALGLVVHQMAGVDLEQARSAGAVPDGHDVVTAFAIGWPGPSDALPEEVRRKDAVPRSRKPLQDFVFGADWGAPAPWLAQEAA